MMQNSKFKILKIFIFTILVVSFFLYSLSKKYFSLNSKTYVQISNKENYLKECIELFKKIRHPKNETLFRPPLKEIPKKLYDEFTQNGWMPVRQTWYINEVYEDSISKMEGKIPIVSKKEVDDWRQKVKQQVPLNYGNTEMQRIMFKYSNELKKRNIAIIGTQLVWIEAISLEIETGLITTLDYTRKQYEQSDLLEWVHVNDFLDNSIKSSKVEQFDNAVSFSSIEHSGLGRYGDPLDPNGDIEAVRQVHCMLKPGGLFFLGLPSTNQDKGFIDFNAHRYYGFKRLELLFQGWEKVDETSLQNGHVVYVLKKKENL